MCAALSLVAAQSFAGDYHFGVDLVCSDCHVMHYSQSHGDTLNAYFTPIAGGPHEFLLRNDVNDLCLSCHDGQAFAPDVLEDHSGGFVRQAGGLNLVGGVGDYAAIHGHSLGSTDVAPGSSPAWSNPAGLNCADCHAPHGRAAGLPTGSPEAARGGYRNRSAA
jgi:predicted CxxxxCH...CXXCH cytochrome family protein